MSEYYTPPEWGEAVTITDGKPSVPDKPIVLFIEGDGVGPDVWKASRLVMDGAVEAAYGGKRRIAWTEILAGEKANELTGEWLPAKSLDAIKKYVIAIKGPLTTPVGGGIRSLNVTLRQELDLYACIRPVRYFTGVPTPFQDPKRLDVVIFRENTEDVYSGIEWAEGTPEAKKIIEFLRAEMGAEVRSDSGVGIKPMSRFATRRLVRRAIQYAIDKNKSTVTVMHKGNIMKYTEGAFKQWAYELAEEEFAGKIVLEEKADKMDKEALKDKIIVKNRIADAMFQQVVLRPDEYSVIATMNLNGDYLSDACAALVGGLGMAPGANIGDQCAVFEATHGSAPKYAGQDKVNPGSVMLSGAMMLEYMGWDEASALIQEGIEATIMDKTVTYDLERNTRGATLVSCSRFAELVVENIKKKKK